VLIIDDDPDIRRILQIALRNLGPFDVRVAADASEALRLASATPPDLVLLDVSMPLADGPQTLARLRGLPSMKDVPVAFLTAAVDDGLRSSGPESWSKEALRGVGAVDIIAKPFDLRELCARVRGLLPSRVG
jgi:two-component system OmpR family response regulator